MLQPYPREACPETVDRITDGPDMTSAVDRGRKALTQQHYYTRALQTLIHGKDCYIVIVLYLPF